MDKATLQRLRLLETRRAGASGPVDDLSESLWEFGRELAALDEPGRALMACELEIAAEAPERMARSYTPHIRRK